MQHNRSGDHYQAAQQIALSEANAISQYLTHKANAMEWDMTNNEKVYNQFMSGEISGNTAIQLLARWLNEHLDDSRPMTFEYAVAKGLIRVFVNWNDYDD
jgi:hypothetical protein